MTGEPVIDGAFTVGRLLDERARDHGEREFLVAADRDKRWSYARFAGDVKLAARGLLALGIRRGEHIAVLAPNVPEWLVLQFAVAKIGAVLVLLDPRWGAADLDRALSLSDATTLFLAPRAGDADLVARLRDVVPELESAPVGHATFAHLPRLRRIAVIGRERLPGMLRYDDLFDLAAMVPPDEAARREGALGPVDIAALTFTRGTTGAPKPVVLSQRNVLHNAVHATAALGVTESDRVACGLPYVRPLGFAAAGLGTAARAATLVLTEDLDAVPLADAVVAERCSVLFTTPLLARWLTELPGLDRRDFAALRSIVVGDEGLTPDDARRIRATFASAALARAYGLVEASAVVAVADDPTDEACAAATPLTGVQVSIVDAHTGSSHPPGAVGELRVRGHGNMRGYYKAPAETAAVVDEFGWLRTGDLASLDERGRLRIAGRQAVAPSPGSAPTGPTTSTSNTG